MKRYLIFLGIVLTAGLIFGANQQIVTRAERTIVPTKDTVKANVLKKILWEQVRKGESALYDKSFDIETYKYSQNDFECLIPYLVEILKEQGYKQPSKKVFAKRIKEVFGRIIDYSTNSKYLYVNMDNAKDRNHKYYRSDNSIEIHPLGIFVLKEFCFVTQLYSIPEVIDYEAVYPGMYQKECQIEVNQRDKNGDELLLYLWKDDKEINISDNIRIFVARNKYLFNNDSTQLEWLLKKDEIFMKSLIKTFEYSE